MTFGHSVGAKNARTEAAMSIKPEQHQSWSPTNPSRFIDLIVHSGEKDTATTT